ncbi:Exportin-2 [Blattella germanica]|nr:Exportin-2 [Blattella germanica]
MRSFSSLQERVIPFLGNLLPKLTAKLALAARNPSRPHFNHYLFETISISIRIVCTSNSGAVGSFEEALFPIFQGILQQDIQEFVPYVFQILSLLLEQHNSGTIPEPYMVLFPCLLAPVLWERPGNIHPLVRLLQTFIQTGAAQISASQKVSLIEHFPDDNLSPYMKNVFVLLFHRLSSSRTTKFVKGLIVFFSLYAVKYGASNLITMLDSIQPDMFGRVLEKVIIPDVQKISGNVERKIAAIGITNLLCECPEMLEGSYSRFWTSLLQALIGLFELPEDESTLPDDHFIEIEDTPGYQAAYSQLAFANSKEHDPLNGIVLYNISY